MRAQAPSPTRVISATPARAQMHAGTAALRLSAALALLALGAGSCAAAASELVWRTGFIECGQTQVQARAQCYAGSSLCVSETLSFARPQGRVIVGLHAHSSAQAGPGAKVQALDYHASAWRCAAGKNAGSYLVVLMTRSARSDCAECEYARLYDANGRLLAAELAFNDSGTARADETGRSLMRALLAEPGTRDYRPVYRQAPR